MKNRAVSDAPPFNETAAAESSSSSVEVDLDRVDRRNVVHDHADGSAVPSDGRLPLGFVEPLNILGHALVP